jgi:ribonucleoside-diphosphate reductase alpha chain
MTNINKQSGSLTFERLLTHTDAPVHQQIEWTHTNIEIKNHRTGEVIYRCPNGEFPASWEFDSKKIVASKYFKQARNADTTEHSVKQMVERVVNALVSSGIEQGYFDEHNGRILGDELSMVLYAQYASFNSPVWFNVGIQGSTEKPQSAACFLNAVEDTMESILELAKIEGLTYKHGSGTGVNLSTLRGSKEPIRGGGTASGPVSFMRGYDAWATVILSGGRTRRAARMVILDIDHPDIEEFVRSKSTQEEIVKLLIKGGMSADFTDPNSAYNVARHQSGNNSVRVPDTFMSKVREVLHGYKPDDTWETVNRFDGSVAETKSVKALFRKIAEAAHTCGDPGLLYSDTLNAYNTCAADGEITTVNPCQEFAFQNNSACNLACLNLRKFASDDGTFDTKLFRHVINLLIVAQDIIVDMSSYPTDTITRNSHIYRPLGLGYADLGGLLMSWGIPYDSQQGRDLAASITSCLTAYAYQTSMKVASVLGPFERFEANKLPMEEVLNKHYQATRKLKKDIAGLHSKALSAWKDVLNTLKKDQGPRNAQVTLLMPAGTVAWMMGCSTTGVEPDIGLKKTRALIGGDVMKYITPNVNAALTRLGYAEEEREKLLKYMYDNGHFEGSQLKLEHLPVFDCALPIGTRSLSVDAHIDMCAAIQPFLSGSISKTFNMPHTATVENVEHAFLKAWEKGLKGIAIYRSGSKLSEPLRVREVLQEEEKETKTLTRRKMPEEREARTVGFHIGSHKGYITTGLYEDGTLGEVFLKMAGHGSTVNGLLDSWARLLSVSIQYGVPLEDLLAKFDGMRFTPSGWSGPQIRSANSIIDYVVKWLKWKYINKERTPEPPTSIMPPPIDDDFDLSSDPCPNCGSQLRKVGATCHECPNCSYNSGVCS